MAREYIDYCAFHTRRFEQAADVVAGESEARYQTADGQRRKIMVQTFTLEFPSGARIVAMPSRPAAMRGRGGDVDADEMAFHEDQAALYKAAVSCTKWGGQFAAWSSHNGEGTVFHTFERNSRRALAAVLGDAADRAAWRGVALEALTAAARTLNVRPVFSLHHTTIVRAIAQGLVELLNRVTGAHYTRAEFLAECRDECLNEEHYRQEYMCEATTALLAALKYHVIEQCQHEACPAPLDGYEQLDVAAGLLRAGYTGGPLFAGLDVGRTQDLSVLWVWEAVGDVLWARLIYRLARTSMPDQEHAVARLLTAPGVRLGRLAGAA